MKSRKPFVVHALGLALAGAIATPAFAGPGAGDDSDAIRDFGLVRDHQLAAHGMQLFGIEGPLDASSTESVSAAMAEANPLSLVTLAHSLRARVVSSSAALAPNIDMMALWPATNPTHLIACNEQDAAQPGVQRVRLSDGMVETILTGTVSCDPVHTTAWGTVIVGEEAGNSGTVLEIMDPLHTTNVAYDRAAGTFSGGTGATNITERTALGHLSFEGVVAYPNGVMYYGDENRPSTGKAGGAYFKFVPTTPWTGTAPITSLAQSPLASGTVYGLRLGLRSGATDYGQGSNTGLGAWVKVDPSDDADLRAASAALQLTGYYRPEDANADMNALAAGNVRFCANNTGNEENDHNWGETICVTDGSLTEATANTATPEVQLFVVGTREFAMMDNIAWQPGRGNWILHEDGDAPGFAENPHNNDIWACLEDGADDDTLSDGCIRIVTLNDLNAESTGGFFDATGRHYYFSVQHNVTGHGTILDVTGWR